MEEQEILEAAAMISVALQNLGNGDAATHMGALEAHGKVMLEASEKMAAALHDIANAIDQLGDK